MPDQFPPQCPAFDVVPPRNSFGPRLTARAGDVWRALQDVVVDQSASVGWTAQRYVDEDSMFVVRTMTVAHQRELGMGARLIGRTWPSRARRDMLFTREVRLFDAGTLLASATQEWVLLSRELQPKRAGADLYAAFSVVEGYPHVELPTVTTPSPGPVHHFAFRTWHTWMDALAHVNHPAYVDFCDEGVAHVVAQGGHDPQRIVPIAEQVHFRAAIGPDAAVDVETKRIGFAGTSVVTQHRLKVGETVCATAILVRGLLGATDTRWAASFGG